MEYGSIILENGDEILFKPQFNESQAEGPVQASLNSAMKKAKISLINEASKIGSFVASFREAFVAANNDDSLTETEIEVGIDFDSTLGCAIISSSVNCQFKITMKWEKDK